MLSPKSRQGFEGDVSLNMFLNDHKLLTALFSFWVEAKQAFCLANGKVLFEELNTLLASRRKRHGHAIRLCWMSCAKCMPPFF